MTREPLCINGLQRAIKSVFRRLPRNCNPRLTISCYANLYTVAMNIRSAVRVVGGQVASKPEFDFRIRLRYVKRGWKLSARHAGKTVTFESSKDV